MCILVEFVVYVICTSLKDSLLLLTWYLSLMSTARCLYYFVFIYKYNHVFWHRQAWPLIRFILAYKVYTVSFNTVSFNWDISAWRSWRWKFFQIHGVICNVDTVSKQFTVVFLVCMEYKKCHSFHVHWYTVH
jgi:hypothetical protein